MVGAARRGRQCVPAGTAPALSSLESCIHAPETYTVTPVVRLLLAITVGAFFLQMTLPGLADMLVFVPQPGYIVVRPWTIVTYMFLHGGLTHIAFNMLALFFFGPRVEERIGSREFTILYFLSGIAGALLSFAFSSAPIIGASAGVFGVTLAFAYYWPDAIIHVWGIIPVPARMMVILTTVMSLWAGFGGRGGGIAHFAHLGGYVGAYLYLKWLERGRTSFKKKVMAVPPAADRSIAAWKSVDRSKIHEVNREEVDRILDKISAQGIGSLTPQEKIFLSNFVPPDDRVPPTS
jgi:membrane associated rhomboid family serine protease